MTKKRIIQLSIVVILAVLATYLTINNHNGTIKKELRDFAVEDTASVDKIFLVDKQNNSILLERKDGYWALNNDYIARQDLVNILLKTLHRIRVNKPVAKAAQQNIIKSLAAKSVKVEIYQNGELSKVMYVGGPTQDSYGTYMILENSSTPFIMEIPGFRGYLSPRFSTFEIEWKTQNVFNIKLRDIKKVTVENGKDNKKSFTVTHNNNHYELFDYKGNKVEKFDTIKVKKFLLAFRKKNFNKYIEDVPEKWQDSIKQSKPMYIVTVEKADGTKQWIKAFNKPGWGRVDFFGEELKTDPDNFFLLMDKGDFVYAQYYSFDPILKTIDDFKPDKK